MNPERLANRQDQRRQEIAQIALDMVAENGLDSVTTGALAKRLQVTPGALYRYFASKEEILVAVELLVLERFAAVFEAATPLLKTLPPMERVIASLELYRRLESDRPGEFRVLAFFVGVPHAVIPDDMAIGVLAPTMSLFEAFSESLAIAQEAGVIEPGQNVMRAVVLWSAVHGVLERRKLSRFAPEGFDIETIYRTTANSLLTGWGADTDLLELAWNQILDRADFANIVGQPHG